MSKQTVQYYLPAGIDGVELLTCSHVGMDFPAHIHDTLTIWVNDLGCEYFRFKGNTTVLDRSGFGVVNAGEVHANGAVASSIRSLKTFYLDTATCSGLFEHELPILPDGLHIDAQMHLQLAQLHDILLRDLDILESQAQFIDVFSELFARHGGLSDLGCGSESMRFSIVRDLLHEGIVVTPSLHSLAEAAECTPQHVMRLFRTHSGVSPHTYLVCLRISRVKHLLRAGWSVAAAASECGFSDQSHCTRWFRKLAGTTPAAYKLAVQSA